ncbi:hypothetical protein BpHYR1_023280 [Brachionus plicatilis]|uniref:Uncharacterized protein n=1 Tax=Brachionus plicatilis TaxID=10195 RepID=A0A3M7Q4K2_BRAPC|nr:hypothetical protein BpHYR1_023280 [Brachionus plicatilis]
MENHERDHRNWNDMGISKENITSIHAFVFSGFGATASEYTSVALLKAFGLRLKKQNERRNNF